MRRRLSLTCAVALLGLGPLAACSDDSTSTGSEGPTERGTSLPVPTDAGSSQAAPGAPTDIPSDDETDGPTDGPTAPLPTTTVTGTDAAYCQAALEAGLAADIESLRSSITVLASSLPSRAGDDVVQGLTLLRDLYADADDLASAGEAYADASKSDQAAMDAYFAFQADTCD